MEVAFTTFAQHLDALRRQFRVLPLEDIVSAVVRNRTLPPGAVAITFDDGYRDNFELAAPLLEKHGFPASFFIIGDNLGRGRPPELYRLYALLDRLDGQTVTVRAGDVVIDQLVVDSAETKRKLLAAVRLVARTGSEPQRRMLLEDLGRSAGDPDDGRGAAADSFMSIDQVLALRRQGFDIGGHSMTHARLATLDPAAKESEVAGVRQSLEEIGVSGKMPFAYPFGQPQDFDSETKSLVRKHGFYCGLSTISGFNRRGTDLYELQRLEVRDIPCEDLIVEASGLAEGLRYVRRKLG